MNHLVEILLTLRLTCLIMQQKHIKNISHVDTSSFALKLNLTGLKTELGKSDIDKLVPVPVDLKLVSAIFYQIFIIYFYSKTVKSVFYFI